MWHLLLLCNVLALLTASTMGFQFCNSNTGRSLVSRSVLSLGMSALNDSPMELCEENAILVIEEVKAELGTIFGYDQG